MNTWSNRSMLRSLTIKFVMLAGMLGLLVRVGWFEPNHIAATQRMADQHSRSPTHAVASIVRGQGKDLATNAASTLEPRWSAASRMSHPTPDIIDLNRSTTKALEALPGIGPILAQRIVDHRRQIGTFQSIQDLDHIQGIGTQTLRAIRPLLKISQKFIATKQEN